MKAALLSALCVLAVLFSGCTDVIASDADEIKSRRWEYSDGVSISSTLTFKGDEAFLTVRSGGEEVTISGLCVFGDEDLVILDALDEFVFGYRLDGKTLTLTYEGRSIEYSVPAQ